MWRRTRVKLRFAKTPLISCDFLYFGFGHLFEDGISPMDSFEKELKDRVGEVGKEHEREAREKSKGAAKLRQKGFKWVELHLQEKGRWHDGKWKSVSALSDKWCLLDNAMERFVKLSCCPLL